MKKTILFCLLCLSVIAINLTASQVDISKGRKAQIYGVLVTSFSTTDQYGTVDMNCTLISSTSLMVNGVCDIDIENDTNGKTVFVSTFSSMNTSGRDCRPMYAGMPKSWDGRNLSPIYSRCGAGLSNSTTVWLIILGN